MDRPVAIFWDYENIRFPSDCVPSHALEALRSLALSHGSLASFKAYMETSLERGHRSSGLRSQLQNAGVTICDTPHNGKKDVADAMIMCDMLVFALKSPVPPVVILVTGDKDFAYACSTLRNHRCTVILVTSNNASQTLRQSVHEVHNWRSDILKLPPVSRVDKYSRNTSYASTSTPAAVSSSDLLYITAPFPPESVATRRRMHVAYLTHAAPPPYEAISSWTGHASTSAAPLPERGAGSGKSKARITAPRERLRLAKEARGKGKGKGSGSGSAKGKGKEKEQAMETLTLSDDPDDELPSSDYELYDEPAALPPQKRKRASPSSSARSPPASPSPAFASASPRPSPHPRLRQNHSQVSIDLDDDDDDDDDDDTLVFVPRPARRPRRNETPSHPGSSPSRGGRSVRRTRGVASRDLQLAGGTSDEDELVEEPERKKGTQEAVVVVLSDDDGDDGEGPA
ncbi:hypothetical protein JCM1841_003756 [Sporobolomyces salmonicolor]